MDQLAAHSTLIDSWVFDLDNTLYPASCSLFPQIDRRMRLYIATTLDIPDAEAHRLQKDYYHRFGTTLRGLMLNHGVQPEAFLEFVHEIDCSVLPAAPELVAAIGVLPGRKIVFTNGSEKHALNVLEQLQLTGHFEAVFDIRASGYLPKPAPEAYDRLIARHALDSRRCVMFEDIGRNLTPAARLGMTTVLVRDRDNVRWGDESAAEDLSAVDYETDDLTGWLRETAPILAGTRPDRA